MSSKHWLIVGISGVTCSGKSTLAKELHKHLNGSVILHQDNYFLPPDDPRHVKIPELNHNNWEILTSVDMHKMYLDILKIIECQTAQHESGEKSKHVLILDGFLLFGYKAISDLCNLKYFLTLTKEQCWKRRKFRSYNPPDVPGYFDKVVWPEYLNHLSKITKDDHAYTKITFIDGSMDKEQIFRMVFTKVQELLF